MFSSRSSASPYFPSSRRRAPRTRGSIAAAAAAMEAARASRRLKIVWFTSDSLAGTSIHLACASPLAALRWISLFPGVSLKWRLERRLGDTAGVVRDRGRGNDGNDLQGVVFAETGRDESIDVLVVETSTFFDHCLRQSRQRSKLSVLR